MTIGHDTHVYWVLHKSPRKSVYRGMLLHPFHREGNSSERRSDLPKALPLKWGRARPCPRIYLAPNTGLILLAFGVAGMARSFL